MASWISANRYECKDKWVGKTNNCSSPILKKYLDSIWHGACTLHDLCYLSFNVKRIDCDKWFLHNLKQTCLIAKKFLCKATAYAMYFAVRLFGKSPFEKGQEWAKVNCTSESPTSTGLEGSGLSGSGTFGSAVISGSGMMSGSGLMSRSESETTVIQ